MELGWCWQQSLAHSLPNGDSSVNQKWLHVDDILGVSLGSEKGTEHGTVNVSDGLIGWWCHVDREELTLETVGDVISTTAWMVHGSQELEVVDGLEGTSQVLLKEVETFLVNELASDLEGNLVTPSVDERHAQVVQEEGHLLIVWWNEDLCLFTLDF